MAWPFPSDEPGGSGRFALPCEVTNSVAGLGTGAPIIESPYGDPVNPEDAPESISRAVASLPPEQMFELMKQMKVSEAESCAARRQHSLCHRCPCPGSACRAVPEL